MTNFLVLLAIGAALGWLMTARGREFRHAEMLSNIVGGALGSFSAGLAANGRGLYAGLSAFGVIGSVAGALVVLGLLGLARNRHPR